MPSDDATPDDLTDLIAGALRHAVEWGAHERTFDDRPPFASELVAAIRSLPVEQRAELLVGDDDMADVIAHLPGIERLVDWLEEVSETTDGTPFVEMRQMLRSARAEGATDATP